MDEEYCMGPNGHEGLMQYSVSVTGQRPSLDYPPALLSLLCGCSLTKAEDQVDLLSQ